MGFIKTVPYFYISVNFYIYFKYDYAENSFSHLQNTIKNDRTIDLSFAFHRSSFAKMADGHVGPRLSPGTKTELRMEGSTMALLMILVRRPSGPSYRYAIGYRDTRAEMPVG